MVNKNVIYTMDDIMMDQNKNLLTRNEEMQYWLNVAQKHI